MKTFSPEQAEPKSRAVAGSSPKEKGGGETGLQQLAALSPQVKQLQAYQKMADNHLLKSTLPAQPVAQLRPLILIYKGDAVMRVESTNLTAERLRFLLTDPRLAGSSKAEIEAALIAGETLDGAPLAKPSSTQTSSPTGTYTPSQIKLPASLQTPSQTESDKPAGPELRLTRNDKAGIFDIAASLIKALPPKEFAYVALGNSPAPIMHMVQEMTKGSTVILSLPMSDVTTADAAKIMEDGDKKKNLFLYLSKYVSPDRLQREKVVVIDIAAGGKALRTAWFYLQQYYKSLDAPIEVRMQALNETPPQPEKLEGEAEEVIPNKFPALPPLSKEQQDAQEKLVQKSFNKRYLLKEWEPAPLKDILSGELRQGQPDKLSAAYTADQIKKAHEDIRDDTTREKPKERVAAKEVSPADVPINGILSGTAGDLLKKVQFTFPGDVKKEKGETFTLSGATWLIVEVELPATPSTGKLTSLALRLGTKYTIKRIK
ncbi:MAG TPA: hypothetical protein VL832_11665 [Puia sp.]|nr:hypothetical protein [Puia sp.]